MNLMVLGLFSLTKQGIDGAIYLMIGHGFVSAGLFFCVGTLYDRYHTRLIKYYGGLNSVAPILSLMFLIFTLANMGFPGTCNFIGEIGVFIGLFSYNPFLAICAGTGIVLSAVYSL
jgi:NADH:ubiquinone oxidoreductase subunit 4 (subunit M)